MSEKIFAEYVSRNYKKGIKSNEEKNFFNEQLGYYRNGLATRLPPNTYKRMREDLFVYP